MAFPGPGAEIIRNEEGEVLGWDYPSYEPPHLDPYEEADRWRDHEQRIDWLEEHIDRLVDLGFEEDEGQRLLDWYEPRQEWFTSLERAIDIWKEMEQDRQELVELRTELTEIHGERTP